MEQDYIKLNKETYDNVSKELEDRHKVVRQNEPTPKDYYNRIVKYLEKKDNLNYLELGPGDGIVLKEFADNNFSTTAIEISNEMIKLSKKNSNNTLYINDDIKNVNLKHNYYDVIFAGSFIHLFPMDDLKIVLEKIYNWLNNNGIFFLYTTLHLVDEEGYLKKDKLNYTNENVRFRHRFTEKTLKDVLNDFNFKILEYYTISEPENDRIWQFCICKK